jgi:ATP-dependent exoDNAse (exonuclease V) alpha subunit
LSELSLSSDQQKVIELYLQGKNLFISGGAGTGKSFLLNYLKLNFSHHDLEITSSTGISAVNIGGTTIHSWAGIGLANQPIEQILNNLLSTKMTKIRKRIIKTKTLAIDEISMISPEVLEILNIVFQEIRQNSQPFGGMQILFFGDFLQLPPVNRNSDELQFCFDSPIWHKLNLQNIILTEIFRQSDKKLINLLNNIRFGKITNEDKKILESRIKIIDDNSAIRPTILTTHNAKVEMVNNNFLKKISAPIKQFTAEYSGDVFKIEFLKKNCLAYQQLTLKVGAQVMMIKNTLQKEGIVNGSLGIVRDFSVKKNYPIVEFNNGKTLTVSPESWQVEKFDSTNKTSSVEASLTQVPLILAWAITIHKSQGLTLDKISCDLSDSFTAGQSYVALSRARTLDGIFIESINFNKIHADPQAVNFYQKIIDNL